MFILMDAIIRIALYLEYSYIMDIPHLAAFDPRHESLHWNLWFVGGTLVQALLYTYSSKRKSNGATVDTSVLFVPCCFCCAYAAHSM